MEQGDCLANLLYYGWVKHGIAPSLIYNMSKGEQALIRAFYVIENEELSKHLKGR